mgnify:CR=1 FL=1
METLTCSMMASRMGERNNGVKQKNLECSLDMNLVEHNLYIV